jgi:hypothetical protein
MGAPRLNSAAHFMGNRLTRTASVGQEPGTSHLPSIFSSLCLNAGSTIFPVSAERMHVSGRRGIGTVTTAGQAEIRKEYPLNYALVSDARSRFEVGGSVRRTHGERME